MSFPADALTLLIQSGKSAATGVTRHAASRKASTNTHLLRWLMSLGGLGLFAVAIIDSSVIPLPLPGSSDLLLLLLASHRGSTVQSAVWLAFCTFAGSMLGGYLTWSAGRKGGEIALERYIPKRLLGRVTGWVKTHGPWTVGLAAILPPPIPLTPFVLAAGALKVPRGPFLAFYAVGRVVRYTLLAWLAVTYGRHIVRVWQQSLGKWETTILWTYCTLIVLGIAFGIWKFRKAKDSGDRPPAQQPAEDMA